MKVQSPRRISTRSRVVCRTIRWMETGEVVSVDDGRGRLVLRDGKIARAEMLV
jgi:hypothetical protein